MSTSFEFLLPENRRIKMPFFSIMVFLTTSFFIGLTFFFTSYYTKILQKEYNDASRRVGLLAMKFVDDAKAMLPTDIQIKDLEVITRTHNIAVGGKRSAWTKLFNCLEEVIPNDSYISSITNAASGEASFEADDRYFNLQISVPDTKTANDFYMKISSHKAFDSLSFSPAANSSDTDNTRISIEVKFRFKENNA
ncbi:MAG: hypothetical protein Kow0029_11930 [Candidatus Rifleibacteriota bacterium]